MAEGPFGNIVRIMQDGSAREYKAQPLPTPGELKADIAGLTAKRDLLIKEHGAAVEALDYEIKTRKKMLSIYEPQKTSCPASNQEERPC